MSTLIRADEAADILGVSKPTLYAYVSRGRLARATGPDGRTSLFDRDELERMAARTRRSAPGPRPTIDVQIRSAVTTMHEHSLEFRGRDVTELVRGRRFEDIAALLWSSDAAEVAVGTSWPRTDPDDLAAIAPIGELSATPIGRLAIAAHALDAQHPGDSATVAAHRLLLVAPALLGSRRRTGPYAQRLAAAWRARPTSALVGAIDTSLALLADHELATSTLAVRIAASARTTPYAAFAAGLASIEGLLHGSAAAAAHRLLERCDNESPTTVIRELRSQRELVPGFGHKVYRGVDPRCAPLLESIRPLDLDGHRVAVIDDVIAEVGRTLPHQPNVDLALGALTWIGGLEPETPIFAIARIVGWAAHYDEELDEPPLRFRGVAKPR